MYINQKQADKLNLEIKMHINKNLLAKGAISQETFDCAKEYILSNPGRKTHGSIQNQK